MRSASWVSSSVGWTVGVTGTALKTTDGGTTWTALDPGTTKDLTGVSFVDANNGWIVGLAGTVLRTSNGGTSWVAQSAPTIPAARNLRAVSFFNTTVGVAVGDVGTTTSTIVYTSDGGTTWRSAGTTSTVGLSGVQMVSASNGWAVGGAGVLLKTTNGGATWTPQATPTVAGLSAISFAPGGVVGYFVGNAVLPNWTIYKTTNSGATWTAVNGLGVTGAVNLTGVSCLDANNAVTVGTNGQVRHTTDGGTTWSNQSVNNVGQNALRDVKMIDANNIKTIGDLGMFFSTSNSGNFWSTPMPGTTATYQSTCFIDANHGWAVGSNGSVLRTIDGGLTWSVQQSGITTWRGVFFINVNTGWIVGDGGLVQHTTDGGVTWTAQISPTTQQLNSVSFTSATQGIAVGAGGTVIRTTNGGSTWAVRTSGTTNNLNAAYLVPGVAQGFAVGDGGVVLKTTNRGGAWTTQTSGTTQNLLTVRGVSATAAWAAGNNGTMIKTTNGTAWSALAPGAGTNPIRSVFFFSTTTGWYASNFGIVKKTTDGGTTWVQENAGMPTSALDPPTGIYGAWFTDANNGCLVGDSGTIRKTADGGATWSSQQYGTQNSLNAVAFANGQNGWMSATGGLMLHTADGGSTWSVQKTGSNSSLNAISALTTTTVWAAGDNGAVRRSTDGGQTWTGLTTNVTSNYKAISTIDGVHSIVAGSGAVKFTSDTGATWTTATVLPGQPITGLAMVSATEAFATATRVAGNNVIWHTTDGGANWSAQATSANANLWAICFLNTTTGYACGDNGVILKTTNGGTTWVSQTSSTAQALNAIDFTDASNGIATGANGIVVRTSDGGTTWSAQSSGTARTLSGVGWASNGLAIIDGASGTVLRNANLAGPTTSIFFSPSSPDGTNGWYQSDPSIQLLADRPGSTFYSWASPVGPYSVYTGSFLATQGTPTLFYYSVDASGNVEAPKSTAMLVDFTAPSAPGTITVSGITTSSAQFDWIDGTDALSGVDHYEIYINGLYQLSTADESTTSIMPGLSPLTTYSAMIKTIDIAGNTSASSTAVPFTTADNTPLVTSATPSPVSPNGTNGWYVTTPTVTLKSTPTTVSAYTRYAWDASALATYSVPVAVPSAGTHTLSFWSIDQAGMRDQEATKTLTLKFDNSSPVAPGTLSASGVSTSSIVVSWSGASDAQSGIDHYDLWVGGSKYGTYSSTTATVTGLAVNTTYPVYVVTVNGAGLSAVSSTVSGHTLANPAVSTTSTTTPTSPNGTNGWYVTAPTVSLASLPTTLPAWTYYAWDGGASTTYTVGTQIAMPSDGTHVLSFSSVDTSDATNHEATQTLTLKRDLVAPSPPATVTPVSIDTTTIAVSWTVGFDATSGINHYDLYIDGAFLRSVAGTSTNVTGLAPNSLHSFAVAPVDAAGLVGAQTTPIWAATNALSALATTATAAPVSANGTNGWYVTTPTVSFTVSPTVAANTYSGWDGSALATVSGSVSVPSLGTHTLSFWSVDTGHQRSNEATRQLTYKLDTSSPSSPALTVTPASTTSLSVSWTSATDAQSAIDHYSVYVGGSLFSTCPAGVTNASVTGLSVNTPYTVRVDAINGAGLSASSSNVTTSTLSNSAVFTIASVAPTVADGTHGWYKSIPSVTLSTQPPTVPTAKAYFGWDGASLTTYTVPVPAPSDGVHVLSYLTADTADPTNRETTRTLSLSIDTVAPTPPTSVTAATLDTSSIRVSWTFGADSTSGVDHYDVYTDGAYSASTATTATVISGLTPNSIHTFTVFAVDAAGNVSVSSPSAIGAAAASSPLATAVAAAPAIPNGANGWYVTTPTVSFTVSPTVSAWTYAGWNGSTLTTVTGPLSPVTGGTSALYFWSIDQAGQHAAETTQEQTYRVDTTAPSAPSAVVATGDTTSSLAVTWSASADAESGIDHYDVFLDGVSQGSFSGTTASIGGLSVNHTYAVHVTAVDFAGLAQASGNVDGTTLANPSVSTSWTVSPLAPNGAGGWYVTTPTVTLAALPTALAAKTHYRFDASAVATYTSPLAVPAEGLHSLDFYSVDPADATNRDATTTLSFKLDTAAPGPPATLVATTLDTTSVALTWGLGSDTTSGVDHYLVYVNGAQYGGSFSATSTTVVGLAPNALYTFWVVAVDAAGNASIASPSALAATGAIAPLTTTTDVAPVTPDGLNGWYVTTPTVNFSVAPAEPATTYYRWDGSATQTAAGPIQVPSVGVHTLSYWSVDQAGLRAVEPTNQLTFEMDTLPDVKSSPSATVSIDATRTFVSSNSTNLTWTSSPVAASGFDHYEVWDEYVGSTTGNSYLVTGLMPMTSYGFKIYGVSGAGTYYSQSDTITVETSPAPLPAAPTIVLAKAPAEGYAYVDWSASSDALGGMNYRIWRSLDGVTYSAIATTTGGVLDTTYIDRGLASTTRYWYAISTVDSRGESPLSAHDSSTWDANAPISGPPARPQGLTEVGTDSSVFLSWQASADPTLAGYYVLRAPRSLATSATTLTPTPITSTGFFDLTAVNGEPYYYTVVAVDTSGTIGRPSLEIEGKAQRGFTDELSPHSTGNESPAACICHSAHAAAGTGDKLIRFKGASVDTVCESCHPPANSLGEFLDPLAQSRHAQGSVVSTETPFTCNTCHVPVRHSDEATANLLRVNGSWSCTEVTNTPAGDGFCYSCHGKGSMLPQGDLTGFENSSHANVNAPPTGANVKCDTCHESHSSRNESLNRYSGYMMCMQCHSAAATDPNEIDIWSKLEANESPNAKHPLLQQDQMNGARLECQNCHNTHAVTATTPLVDPHNPSPSGVWTTPLTDQKSFCFRCHNGQALPTSVETTPWANPVLASNAATTVTNIQGAYNTNVHGFGLRSGSATTTAYLRPDMGYSYNTVLECRSCHDPHGTANNYALQQNVTSASGAKTINGVVLQPVPGGGYDLRFFCNTCHVWDSATHDSMAGTSTVTFPTNCTACHRHVKNDGNPSGLL